MTEHEGLTGELAVKLCPDKDAASRARHAVQTRFAPQLPTQQLIDLLVIVSELTTNATLYGVGEIWLRISVHNGRVYGEVIDQGSGFVSDVRDQGIEKIGNKGLLIVATLAEDWGIHEGSSHVWFEIASRDDRHAEHPQLTAHQRPTQLDA